MQEDCARTCVLAAIQKGEIFQISGLEHTFCDVDAQHRHPCRLKRIMA
jgi:hypothetical protein